MPEAAAADDDHDDDHGARRGRAGLARPAPRRARPRPSRPRRRRPTTTVPPTSRPPGRLARRRPAATTTTAARPRRRSTSTSSARPAASPARASGELPQVEFLHNTPALGSFEVGDLVFTAGEPGQPGAGQHPRRPGRQRDRPARRRRVRCSRSSPSPISTRSYFVRIVLYKPGAEVGGDGRRRVAVTDVRGPRAGLRSCGWSRSVSCCSRCSGRSSPRCARSASPSRSCWRWPRPAGAAGGPQKGALAGFVLGLMYDLGVGTPLGSSSITMGLAGSVAGYVDLDHARPAVVAGGAVHRPRRGGRASWRCRSCGRSSARSTSFTPRLYTIVPVVAVAAMVMSARCWCRSAAGACGQAAGVEGRSAESGATE